MRPHWPCAVQTFHLSGAAKSTPGVCVGWIAWRARHLPCEGLSGFLSRVFISWISGQNFLWKPSLVGTLTTHSQDPIDLALSRQPQQLLFVVCGILRLTPPPNCEFLEGRNSFSPSYPQQPAEYLACSRCSINL